MLNKFYIDKDVCFIKLIDGSTTLIDQDDLPKARCITGYWTKWIDPIGKNIYIVSHRKRGNIYLHRIILPTQKGFVVDHINHNGVDNRKSNLRSVTIAKNILNRKGAQINNKTSGIRGISWSKQNKKWETYITINKKRKNLGFYNDLELAKYIVSQAQSKANE